MMYGSSWRSRRTARVTVDVMGPVWHRLCDEIYPSVTESMTCGICTADCSNTYGWEETVDRAFCLDTFSQGPDRFGMKFDRQGS